MRHALARMLSVALALASPVPVRADTIQLQGRYRWDLGGADGTLLARFTPEGAGHWRVSFSFRFDGRDHEYRGSATGSLDGGELVGQVDQGTSGRTFTFRGYVRDGRFTGTHAERGRRGRLEATGTLTLNRE
jgi:hypothetical protein